MLKCLHLITYVYLHILTYTFNYICILFQHKVTPKINFATNECRFRLEQICGQVVALCNCASHLCAFNLSTYNNLFSQSRCLLDLDTDLSVQVPPTRGIDYVVYFKNPKNMNFFGQLGSWFRIWYDKNQTTEKWRFTANAKIQLPTGIGSDTAVYSTMLHSRSKCSLIYDYFPPHCSETQVPMLNIFF